MPLDQNTYHTSQAVTNAFSYYRFRREREIDEALVAKIVKAHEDLMIIHTDDPGKIVEWYDDDGALMVIQYIHQKLAGVDEDTIETVVEGIEDYVNRLL
tara:strand:+ start:2755 stop:3051 length:297 start_codon:yes stop_codon:yes gene_type:complete